MRARRFAEGYTDDERLLATIELHDRPYQIWKRLRRTGNPQDEPLREMLERIPDHDLFGRFVELDGVYRGQEPRADRVAAGRALNGQSSRVRSRARGGPPAPAASGSPSSARPYSPRVESSTTRSSRSSSGARDSL